MIKMKTIKYFNPRSIAKQFFKKLNIGDIFIYSDYFTYQDVMKIAATYNVGVRYCPPRSPEYIEYGCMTCKVISLNKSTKKEAQIFQFDESLIDN